MWFNYFLLGILTRHRRSRRRRRRRRWWRLVVSWLLLEIVGNATNDFIVLDALPPELVELIQAAFADGAQRGGNAIQRGYLKRSTFIDFLQQKLITLVIANWFRNPIGR